MKSLGLVVAIAAMQVGCASDSGPDVQGSGAPGSAGLGSGGKISSGGSTSSGGSPAIPTGGTTGTAGAAGAVATGGSVNPSAGSGGGGVVATGGNGSSGGPSGGSPGSAGSPATGSINWGKEENPTARCTVTGTLPGYADLKPDGKLPDPFTKLDGTRIKNKSEWACRREEILKQQFNYVYGEKPIPAKGSVTGTVSTSKISVKVTEGSKTASFDVTVSMNGATAPAPAIIIFDGGLGSSLPIPTGVAKITLSAIEAQGGSGTKTGPFFTFYGNTHPAGYMVAQAWQVSRIIDLLEQTPGTIDPYHIGVTGCSRNGKGAFAAGVFDNRVALTIPCESGIGGTVGLRLKEQLDPGANSSAEWPYHAISYVRWLSEVALGPFAKANDAAGDNTDRLPVDMHEAMALIAPRGLYIVDNPGIGNLDPKSAYMTAMAGKAIFGALGVADNFAYQGASGDHCTWRTQYTASLTAMIDKFLKGNAATKTGTFATDLGSKPATTQYYTWDTTELPGTL
ncbi:MAG TPA: PE PGRS family protein [Polyangiaceae bacterium]|nr:PE PGRS family protein [Polyangiaceae bacterium]